MIEKINCILLDLDGTLADTAPDLAHTLNTLLIEKNRKPLPDEQIRPTVSQGAGAMISLGFNITTDDPDMGSLRERFLEIYQSCLCNKTSLFPGMSDLIAEIERRGMKWGVITNKPAFLTEPLLENLGIKHRAACIISGDSTQNRKPHIEPMLTACQQIGVTAKQCVYIGDAQRDIEAGNRAGMQTLAAMFGYIGDTDDPTQWDADGLIDSPAEILAWVSKYNASRVEK